MKKYIFEEHQIDNEYKYIFLCGSHFTKKNQNDKRSVLRDFLINEDAYFKPIILEDNFIFKKKSSRLLFYDDINMEDLYRVEMLTNYLADKNIIIHESISTGAETGLFLSEQRAACKTCLLVPDQMAVEEDKIGQFIRLAFMRGNSAIKELTFYPRIEQHIISSNVKNWHTYFYGDKIGKTLGRNILDFVKINDMLYGIKFTQNKKKVSEGFIHYQIKNNKLYITAVPRILLLCVATIFNIEEVQKEVFNATPKMMKEYIEIIKNYLSQIFINTIMEKTGKNIILCSIIPQMNVKEIYISGVLGMSLYLFQAAGLIQIKKNDDYSESKKVKITRKIVPCKDEKEDFFYKKYEQCIGCAIGNQIV